MWLKGVQLLQICGLDFKAAEQRAVLHLSWEVCQGERQTAGPRGPPCSVGGSCCPSHTPTPSPTLPLSFSISDSLAELYSHSITPRQRRTGAIYRRVVLFYLPVSICVAHKYRGLPGCWRQQCSAAERWRLCVIRTEKERRQGRD